VLDALMALQRKIQGEPSMTAFSPAPR
jgi:hypothetical protein